MQIIHLHDVPPNTSLDWIFYKANFQAIRGKRNIRVAFVGKTAEEEQILLSLIREVDTLYLNPKDVKTPELKKLILRLNPEILL
jgi:hypothetical protein